MKRKELYTAAILLCLTLGLAPFMPEPHLIGKWRWLLGGGEGMGAMDWFDLLMHSAPFVFLVVLVLRDLLGRYSTPEREKEQAAKQGN